MKKQPSEQVNSSGAPGKNPNDNNNNADLVDPNAVVAVVQEERKDDWPQDIVDAMTDGMSEKEKSDFYNDIGGKDKAFSFSTKRGTKPEDYNHVLVALTRLNEQKDRLGITGAKVLADSKWALAMIAGNIHDGCFSGNKVNFIANTGITPLHVALLFGDIPMSDVFTGNETGLQQFHLESDYENDEEVAVANTELTANYAIAIRANVQLEGDGGFTHRIDINLPDANGFTPIHWYALSSGCTTYPELEQDVQFSPLRHLVEDIAYSEEEIVKAEAKGKDNQTETKLVEKHMSANLYKNSAGNIKKSSSTADTKEKNIQMRPTSACTPLQLACEVGNTFFIDEFFCKEEHINISNGKWDNSNGSAVTWTAQFGPIEGMQHCLDGNYLKSVNAEIGPNGETACHLAASTGNTDVVKFLRNHGADLMAKTSEGKTSLHLAASNGNEDLTVYLSKKLRIEFRGAQDMKGLAKLFTDIRKDVSKTHAPTINRHLAVEQKKAKQDAKAVPDKYKIGKAIEFKDTCDSVIKVLKAYRRKIDPKGDGNVKKFKAKVRTWSRHFAQPNHHFAQVNRDLIKAVEGLRDNVDKTATDRADDLLTLVTDARESRDTRVQTKDSKLWDTDGKYGKALSRAETLAHLHIQALSTAQVEDKQEGETVASTASEISNNI